MAKLFHDVPFVYLLPSPMEINEGKVGCRSADGRDGASGAQAAQLPRLFVDAAPHGLEKASALRNSKRYFFFFRRLLDR